MEIEKESTKLKERLLRKRNQFNWGEYNKLPAKQCRDHIKVDPYTCYNCGDTYNKMDLFKYKKEHICPNCMFVCWIPRNMSHTSI